MEATISRGELASIMAPPRRGRAFRATVGTLSNWVPDPPDRTGTEIEILPASFDTKRSGCVLCGGTLDFDWTCTRCCADHFRAVRRLIDKKYR